jgi:hypothetical protein
LRTVATASALAFALASLGVGCARSVGPGARDDLAGFESALVLSGGVRAAALGTVQGRPAEIVLELAAPITTVTRPCFNGPPPPARATVRYPNPRGGVEEAAEIDLVGVKLGDRRLGAIRAALGDGEICRVTLGSDVLASVAVWIDPASRKLRLFPSRDRAAYEAEVRATPAGEEAWVIDVERDPSTDWPLLAVRARQGGNVLTGPVVLTTGNPDTTFSGKAMSSARLRSASPAPRDRELPQGVALPDTIGGDAVVLDALELAPGVGLQNAVVRTDPDWSGASLGTLGGDVWGKFVFLLDARAGVLLLRRPRLVASPSRQRCGPSQAATEERCFELHQRASADGVELVATIWRDLPEGASVHLEVLDGEGAIVARRCRVGFSFTPTGRGVSTAHRLPWPTLSRSLPACARALAHAASVRYALLQDGPVEECPGTCVFVEDLDAARMACHCEVTPPGWIGHAERRLATQPRSKPSGGEPRRPPGDR